ncbi:DUF4240 domain-containing protein [Dactylosporangium sp. NPDC050688]|uniref:DUF4240 domain-containing protein n=1 Tax=Dactylosporangium sp. NPDC050688 TaxID=3157217 RepID=UPI0033EFB968
MDVAGFWAIVEGSAQANADLFERADWIAETLTSISDDDLVDFQDHLDDQTGRVSHWLVWHAAVLIMGGCSDDSFSRFRAWLVGLGRDAVDAVAEDPDRLADRPEVRRLAGRHWRTWAEEEYPEWEELEFVAVHEYERRFGEDSLIYDAQTSRTQGGGPVPQRAQETRWDLHDPAESSRRLPRLAAMFPQTDPVQAHR